MAKNSITDYSKTAASNTDIQSVDIAEGCLPSGINNAIREIMADLADMNDGTVTLTSPSFAAASLTGDLSFGDNDKAIFGAGSDLEIYHSGAGSFISDVGNGALHIRGTNLILQNGDGTKRFLDGNDGGAVEIHYADATNGIKLATTSTGIDVTGTVTADGLTVGSGTSGQINVWSDAYKIQGGSNFGDMRFTAPRFRFFESNGVAFQIDNNDISFYEDTGTTAKLFWDASAERLGLGVTSPASKLHVQTASSGATVGGGGDELILENSLTAGLSILSGTSSDGNILFGDSGNSAAGYVQYKHGDDALAFGTVASERLRIDSSGNVGIGTSSPLAILDVKNATNEHIVVSGSSAYGSNAIVGVNDVGSEVGLGLGGSEIEFYTGATERMRIDSSGNVGIGTSSPYAPLTVDTANGILNIANGNTSGGTKIQAWGATPSNGYLAIEGYTKEYMRITSSGRVGIGTSSPNTSLPLTLEALSLASGIQFNDDGGNWNLVVDGNAMRFQQGTAGAGPTERMRIDSSGRVGIGTSSPEEKLSIAGIRNEATLRLSQLESASDWSNGDDLGAVEFSTSDPSGAGSGVKGSLRYQTIGGTGAGTYMSFNVAGTTSGTNDTERMRIDSSGRLFVNTTSLSNYAQTSGDSSWMYRTEEGSVIQAQDADDGFSMMYMNKFDWTSSKDSRYINWYKNGSSVATIALTSGGLISYGTGSDYRLKENVTDMTGGINRIKQINPKQFNLIDDPDDTTMDGFLAHELATVIPEAVVGTHDQVKSRTNVVRNADGNFIEDGVTQDKWIQGKTDGDYPSDSTWVASWDEPIYQTVDYGKVTPLLVAALQEAITKIEDLEARVATLEGN